LEIVPNSLLESPEVTKVSQSSNALPEPEEEVAPEIGDCREDAPRPSPPPEQQNVVEQSKVLVHDKAEVEERLLLERGPFELLSERRKARLIEVERASNAQCTLDAAGQAVCLRGTASAVLHARQMLEELHIEWVDIARAAWAVLLQSRTSPDGHLSRLQAASQCTIVVDRKESKVRIAGTSSQADVAQSWLWQLHESCDEARVRLSCGPKAAAMLAMEVEAATEGVKVDVTSQNGACSAHVYGLCNEVQCAVEQLRAGSVHSPVSTNESTTVGTDLSDKSRSPNSSARGASADPLTGVEQPGLRTPSNWTSTSARGRSPAARPQVEDGWQRQKQKGPAQMLPNGAILVSNGANEGAPPMQTGPGNRDSQYHRQLKGTPPRAARREEGSLQESAAHARQELASTPSGMQFEDPGASSLAARLAREFPTARIFVGSPDEPALWQESRGEAGSNVGRLELQMQRLKELLDKSRAEPL